MPDEDTGVAAQKAAAEAEKKASEEDVLLKTREIIADVGAKISAPPGNK